MFGSTSIWWIAPVCSIVALLSATLCYVLMKRAGTGNERMEEIAGYVRDGAMAYLRQQYSRVGIVFAVLFVIFAVLAVLKLQNPFVPVAFLTGGFFSGLCGFVGMKTATSASSRTAQGASESLNRGLQVAFRSGAVMGLAVVGFGLFDITAWYFTLDRLVYTPDHMAHGLSFLGLQLVAPGFDVSHKFVEITTTMLTFGMGASTQALFARVGGGIYTKAADVGADLVGKVEAGIPEDDPRNPATIADNVGDNVGDVAGMGADLYESYCGSILATAALGASLAVNRGLIADAFNGQIVAPVVAPMIIAAVGIVISILGCLLVRCHEQADMKTLMAALTRPLWLSTAAIAVCPTNTVTYTVTGFRKGCSSEASTTLLTAGNTYTEPTVTIYPNPAHQHVTIQADHINSIDVVNVMGQSILHKTINSNHTRLDTHELSDGIYFIRVNMPGATVVRKLIRK